MCIRDRNDLETDRCKFHEQSEEIVKNIGLFPKRIGFREIAIEKNKDRLKWRRLRVASPKCILCGSTSIHYADENDNGSVAIDGAIVVWIKIRGMCSMHFNEWFFTVDGDRIQRDTKPKYWGITRKHDIT